MSVTSTNQEPETLAEEGSIATAFTSLRKIAVAALVAAILGSMGSAAGIYFSSRQAAAQRGEVCEKVVEALDTVIDAAALANLPADATPAQIETMRQQVEAFKQTYHEALGTCD